MNPRTVKSTLLGYLWGGLTCPTAYACIDHQWKAACVFGCLLAGTFGTWLLVLRQEEPRDV